MDLLARKRKLQLAVSLDTIGREFEQIRIGADWEQIERNILDFQATGKRLGYPWQVSAPCMLLKTNIPRLIDFAEWSISHDVQPGFYDFINAPGIEQTHEAENVVAHPNLLDEVPDWERHFILAIDRLRHSKWTAAADQLDNLYVQLREKKRRQIAVGLLPLWGKRTVGDPQAEVPWQLPKGLRRVRDQLAPEGTRRRRLYRSLVHRLRS
jgi:hypothetical protein